MEKKILKLDQDAKLDVRAFEMTNLSPGASSTFRTPSLASKPPTRTAPRASNEEIPRKDRRFHVDPALRDLLTVDNKTELEVEIQVNRKLDLLRAEAESAARDAGYEAGYAQGKAEAKANIESGARERFERVDELLNGFEAVKDEVYQAHEKFLVELVLRITGTVLQRECLLDREYLGRVVRSIVEKVGVKEQLKIIASPSQLEQLYSLLPEIEKRNPTLKNVTIESSPHLGESDVVIETDFNRIDATLNSQLGSLHEVVLAAFETSQATSRADSESA